MHRKLRIHMQTIQAPIFILNLYTNMSAFEFKKNLFNFNINHLVKK